MCCSQFLLKNWNKSGVWYINIIFWYIAQKCALHGIARTGMYQSDISRMNIAISMMLCYTLTT